VLSHGHYPFFPRFQPALLRGKLHPRPSNVESTVVFATTKPDNMRILIVEDELQLARHITSALTRHGHNPSACHNGTHGLQTALDSSPDLIVLDLNLPDLDGFSVLTQLRQVSSPARVLILTARGEVGHRIKGLNAGADDYLAKPFSMEELVARIEALGRRGTTPTATDLLEVADLHLDVHHRRATRAGKTVALSPREFDLLQVLMQEPGRVFSRTELCERVWQRDHGYDTRTVEIFITRLRKKVDHGFGVPLIRTFRSVGYSICPPPPP
jgi:DNA-binding response OmpR family regulator